ncbi:MAG: TatD family hydrolase [Candidatus Nanopelagicales bacterium]
MSTRTSPPAPEPLPGPLVDSHCHLDICAADDGPSVEQAMTLARGVGIAKVVQVGCDVPSSQWAAEVAAANDDIWAAVALHPNEAPRLAAEEGRAALEVAWAVIDELADLPAVRAIGETGMDFYRTGDEGRAVQEESFRRHIQIAKRVGKTLVVHDRDSHDDVIRILDDEGSPDTVVLHCFSGDAAFARLAAERGWYCSFAGVVTFKNAADLREALVEVPVDRVLVETDAPFLTPVPYRGKPNGPYLVPLTVRAMAEVRGEPLDQLITAIWDNSERAFGPL